MTSARPAPYATDPRNSRGRLHAEPSAAERDPFQRDRDRIVHSSAFRRLKHKTQVFVDTGGDHFRTRLTHSLEVSQIARSIARALGLNEDLTEALALAHDLGHTPFGHAGETALDAAMQPFGGFDHNAQTLRIVTKLERRYAAFDGLNLTWETLEGTVKHNGPLVGEADECRALPAAIVEYQAQHDLELATHPGPEAQVAALSDDIAYNNHDLDDGLRAGLFDIAELEDAPLTFATFRAVRDAHPGLDASRWIHESVRRLIDAMVTDLLAETRRRLAEARPGAAADVRALGRPLVAFSEPMRAQDRELKAFLHRRMYRHYKVNRMASNARRVVSALFARLFEEPCLLPPEWQSQCDGADPAKRARVISDYIAGMTDRFAEIEHRRLTEVRSSTL
ncbi:MAG: deoxyguanosinetriphosphate triphosphohydrolase [Alphaproteobacteria bacterium]